MSEVEWVRSPEVKRDEVLAEYRSRRKSRGRPMTTEEQRILADGFRLGARATIEYAYGVDLPPQAKTDTAVRSRVQLARMLVALHAIPPYPAPEEHD